MGYSFEQTCPSPKDLERCLQLDLTLRDRLATGSDLQSEAFISFGLGKAVLFVAAIIKE